jgi:PKD repeat protein
MFCAPLLIDTNAINPGNGCNAFYAFMQLAPYQVTVVNLSSGLNLSFDWDFGDGSPHDTNPYPSHVYTSTGSYNLCLTVADANGCTSTYCDTMSVDSLGNIYRMASPGFIINVLSPAMVTGVKEVAAENAFGVYPNPFTSELRISLLNSSMKAENYRILSVQGAEIMRGKMEGANGTINTQSLSSGVYLLEITMNDGSRSFQRVIKN